MKIPIHRLRDRIQFLGFVVVLSAAPTVPLLGQTLPQSGPATVRPGAPGSPTQSLSPNDLLPPPRPQHTAADVAFMRAMIEHHRQALVMSALAPDRADRADVRGMADRIGRSQAVEIAFMERWLQLRGESMSPSGSDAHHDPHAHHGHQSAGSHGDEEQRPMAGMLTERELASLEGSQGADFDQRFLEFMIMHHEGALIMVEELFASPGSMLDPDIFELASHIYSDQQMEITRMRSMLAGSL